MADEPKTTDTPADAPYAPPASGNDPDSRQRALKAQLATATTSGDDDTAEDLRGQLDKLRQERVAGEPATDRETAAAARRTAAEMSEEDKTTAAPVGRAAPRKSATQG